jgi:hypothetical protein
MDTVGDEEEQVKPSQNPLGKDQPGLLFCLWLTRGLYI